MTWERSAGVVEADPAASAAVAVTAVIIAAIPPASVPAISIAAAVSAVAAISITAAGGLHPAIDRPAAVVAAYAGVGPVDRAAAMVVGNAGAFAPVMAGAGGGGGEGGEADKSGAEEAEQFHGGGRALVVCLIGGTAVAATPLLIDSGISDGLRRRLFMYLFKKFSFLEDVLPAGRLWGPL